MDRTILVYSHWDNKSPTLLGFLYISENRGKEIYSFEFDQKWLATNGYPIIDPELYYYPGRQYAENGDKLFGIIMDSCPDRWGRTLMQRREAIEARLENRKPRTLRQSDYLLGVYDEARMGALRFKEEGSDNFSSFDDKLATPPMTALRELEAKVNAYERDETGDETDWLNMLFAPGSSLGGARPKATVKDVDGSLWIAKFPSKADTVDVGAWEYATSILAGLCGLNVPETRALKLTDGNTTFLTKRFDREGERRIHFSSAMTMLGRADGEEASYLEIADFLKQYGAEPANDLKELWRRIVFSILISNTDDHLRNHGFILGQSGWRLSPMYDVNPSIDKNYLSLYVSNNDSSLDEELAVDVSEYFGISKEKAVTEIETMKKTIEANFDRVMKECRISDSSKRIMEPAFQRVL